MDNNGYQPDTSTQGHVGHQELQPHSAMFQQQYDTAYQQPYATMNQPQNDMDYHELRPHATINQPQNDMDYHELQPHATINQPQNDMDYHELQPHATINQPQNDRDYHVLQPHAIMSQRQHSTAYHELQPHAKMNQLQYDTTYYELQPLAEMNQLQYDGPHHGLQPHAEMSQPQQRKGCEPPISAARHTPGEPLPQSPPEAQASGFQEPPPGNTTKRAYNGPPSAYYPPSAPGINVNIYNNQYMGNQPVPVVVAQPMVTTIPVVQTDSYEVRPIMCFKSPSYIGLAICTLCVNFLFGIFALIASILSMIAYYEGDIEKARKLGKVVVYMSLIGWIITSVVILVVFFTVTFTSANT